MNLALEKSESQQHLLGQHVSPTPLDPEIPQQQIMLQSYVNPARLVEYLNGQFGEGEWELKVISEMYRIRTYQRITQVCFNPVMILVRKSEFCWSCSLISLVLGTTRRDKTSRVDIQKGPYKVCQVQQKFRIYFTSANICSISTSEIQLVEARRDAAWAAVEEGKVLEHNTTVGSRKSLSSLQWVDQQRRRALRLRTANVGALDAVFD
ncbi:hypothetical protein F5Y18DRAFT_389477 [Xylariaceae sp. FL1019]|nr:hypothetical protein F5Y18DRAFT_389477 [Xylariaceae sp. FL1019]